MSKKDERAALARLYIEPAMDAATEAAWKLVEKAKSDFITGFTALMKAFEYLKIEAHNADDRFITMRIELHISEHLWDAFRKHISSQGYTVKRSKTAIPSGPRHRGGFMFGSGTHINPVAIPQPETVYHVASTFNPFPSRFEPQPHREPLPPPVAAFSFGGGQRTPIVPLAHDPADVDDERTRLDVNAPLHVFFPNPTRQTYDSTSDCWSVSIV